ncbi:MAG TPA: hypothetical protein VFR04_09350 [Solirubrobacterales bacterium]|nr:hypothetical protein [Solirubrobacterales bacterium]
MLRLAERSIAAFAITLSVALAAAGGTAAPAGAAIPWGAGCTSLPPSGARTSSTCAARLVDGRAIAPPWAPAAVKEIIAAANRIDDKPYVWGGGHTGWLARGYDCSGAVGYALHGAELLDGTMVSGELAHWGEPGVGRWVTVYANAQHVFMVVAGLRFDTRGNPAGVSGPRWHQASVDPVGFASRHPAGL